MKADSVLLNFQQIELLQIELLMNLFTKNVLTLKLWTVTTLKIKIGNIQ